METVYLALIAILPTMLASLLAWLTLREAKAARVAAVAADNAAKAADVKVEDLAVKVDGRLTKLLELTESNARADEQVKAATAAVGVAAGERDLATKVAVTAAARVEEALLMPAPPKPKADDK